ncbi:PsaB RNA-binding protein, putative [Medicago truncatula]|uniref:PsaB RNA-binding protein, putative n=1 Tax=Medicago truncatula TaxID=3880 RepID=G7LAH2_MEDTR|nr:PsaB RNA-binding protein, putative [Medicago truncatula]
MPRVAFLLVLLDACATRADRACGLKLDAEREDFLDKVGTCVGFCSRPILDVRGKKIWELVVCDKSLSLQYTKYFPNNVTNCITLKDSIVAICDDLDLPLPRNICFFM